MLLSPRFKVTSRHETSFPFYAANDSNIVYDTYIKQRKSTSGPTFLSSVTVPSIFRTQSNTERTSGAHEREKAESASSPSPFQQGVMMTSRHPVLSEGGVCPSLRLQTGCRFILRGPSKSFVPVVTASSNSSLQSARGGPCSHNPDRSGEGSSG